MMKYIFKLDKDTNNLNAAFRELGLSNAAFKKYFYQDLIKVDGKLPHAKKKISKNSIIEIDIIDEEMSPVGEGAKSPKLLYEDDYIIAINKPTRLLTHESKNFSGHTLRDDIAFYFKNMDIRHPVRFINRLDMDTSGVIIIAKSDIAQGYYAKANKLAIKEYIAVCKGNLYKKTKVDRAIGRDELGIKRKLDEDGLSAKTIFTPIYNKGDHSIIKAQILTGRTHQIRLHLMSLGIEIIGDNLYGTPSDLIDRQALHSLRYRAHSLDGKKLDIYAPLEEDILNLIRGIF
ncbi:MAG: RluA family pseudouridine synthase [Ezakiella sp.]|nr:RluA family pseudouridine synthase [Ezakiella sp.]